LDNTEKTSDKNVSLRAKALSFALVATFQSCAMTVAGELFLY